MVVILTSILNCRINHQCIYPTHRVWSGVLAALQLLIVDTTRGQTLMSDWLSESVKEKLSTPSASAAKRATARDNSPNGTPYREHDIPLGCPEHRASLNPSELCCRDYGVYVVPCVGHPWADWVYAIVDAWCLSKNVVECPDEMQNKRIFIYL